MGKPSVNRLNIEKGMRFGSMTIIEECEKNEQGRRRFLCRCDCGKEKVVGLKELRNGKTKTCGCRIGFAPKIDINKYMGQRFGRLTIIGYGEKTKENKNTFRCKCDCGNEKDVVLKQLRLGKTQSCGCLAHDKAHERFLIDNRTSERLYDIWQNMKARCNRPSNAAYKYYGARGIQVCDEWNNDYLQFKNWAMNNGYDDSLTIDRIDVNGNYESSNCRWATYEVQSNNRRNNLLITSFNQTHTAAEWGRILNIKASEIRRLYHKGYSLEEIIKEKGVSV